MAKSSASLPAAPLPAAFVPTARADLCLEFANTRYWRGTGAPTETLHALNDVIEWCARSGTLDAAALRALKRWWQAHPAKTDAAYQEAVELREAIYRIFAATAAGDVPKETDLAILARALAETPARAALRKTDGGYAWSVGRLKASVTDALAAVLWSAGDLLVGPKLVRVRRCANEKCLWVFLDESKSGTRRWCAMSACGNRAKAHRHYAKTKKNAGKQRS